MLIGDASRAEAGSTQAMFGTQILCRKKCYTKHAASRAYFRNEILFFDQFDSILPSMRKNLLLNGLNIKIEREVIETHNLYSPKRKSNMQI